MNTSATLSSDAAVPANNQGGGGTAASSSSAATTTPGIVVKTVVGATTVYDAAVGQFIVGSTERVMVATCGVCLKLFRRNSSKQQHSEQTDRPVHPADAASCADGAWELISTHPVDGTALSLGKCSIAGNADQLVVVLEKMDILLLRFELLVSPISNTNDGAVGGATTTTTTTVAPVLIGRVDAGSPIALRADNGDMVVATNGRNMIALHAHQRHLQLFFIEQAKDTDAAAAGSRRPRTPDPNIAITHCSLRLAEQQVIALAFLKKPHHKSGGAGPGDTENFVVEKNKNSNNNQGGDDDDDNNNNNNNNNNNSNSQFVGRQQQQHDQLVVLYRDRRQAVHVSMYIVRSRDSVTLASKALVPHLERTASFIVPLNNGGFAVCGATQATIVNPPTQQQREQQQQQQQQQQLAAQQQAEDKNSKHGGSASSSSHHRLNVNKTTKQMAVAATSTSTATQQASQLWGNNSLTIGYYPETPARITTAHLPGAVSLCSLNENEAEEEDFIAVALNNGQLILVDAVGKSKRAFVAVSPSPSSSLLSSSRSCSRVGVIGVATPSACVALAGSQLALFSLGSSATVVQLAGVVKKSNGNAGERQQASKKSSSSTTNVANNNKSMVCVADTYRLLENSGPVLSSAVATSRQPTTELVAVSGAAAESTLCKYRSGASAQVVASIPNLEGLCAVYSAARSSLLMDVSVGMRHLAVSEDAIEEMNRADCSASTTSEDSEADASSFATPLLCTSVDDDTATLLVTPSKVVYSRVSENGESVTQSATWAPSSSFSNNNSNQPQKLSARIVAAAFDPASMKVVVALHGGRFVVLRKSSAAPTLQLVETASMDFSATCITCSALALSPGGDFIFFASWGNPSIFCASSSSSSSSDVSNSSNHCHCCCATLPATCMAKSCCVLSCGGGSGSGSGSSSGSSRDASNEKKKIDRNIVVVEEEYLLVAMGTTDGRVFIVHVPAPAATITMMMDSSNNTSSSGNSNSVRIDSFSIGSSPVSLTSLTPMVFPPVKSKRPAILCCGDYPCYLLMNTIHHRRHRRLPAASNHNQSDGAAHNDNATTVGGSFLSGVEPEVVHLAVGPLLSAAQISPVVSPTSASSSSSPQQPLIALVTKNRELQLVRALTDSLLHRTISEPRHQQQQQQQQQQQNSKNVAVVVSHVAHVGSQGVFVAATCPTNSTKAVVSVLSATSDNVNSLQLDTRVSSTIGNSNASADSSSSSSPSSFFPLLENEVCAALQCLHLQHRLPSDHHHPHQQQQQHPAKSNKHQQQQQQQQHHPIFEHLVVATRRFGGDSKAGGRLLLLDVEEKTMTPTASNNKTENNEDASAAAQEQQQQQQQQRHCLKLVAECDVSSNAIAAVCSAFGHRLVVVAGGSVSLYSILSVVSGAATSTSNNNNNNNNNNTSGSGASPASIVTLCPEMSIRVSLCSTSASSFCPSSNRVFVGDALHSVSAVSVSDDQLHLASKDVCRRRVIAVLALSDDVCLASDEAMNICLFHVGGNNNNSNNNSAENGGAATIRPQGNNKIDKCSLMVCLGSWHMGDRITTLSHGSALAGGYTPGKWLRRERTAACEEDEDADEDVANGDGDDENNNKRQLQLLSSGGCGGGVSSPSSSSSSLVQQSIVAGTTCGAVLSLSLVDDTLRCFLATLTGALERIAPSRSRVRTRVDVAESRAGFRAEHSFDDETPAGGRATTAVSSSAAAAAAAAVSPSAVAAGGAATVADIGAALFVDGDELERLHTLATSSSSSRGAGGDGGGSVEDCANSSANELCQKVFAEAGLLVVVDNQQQQNKRQGTTLLVPGKLLPPSFRHVVEILTSSSSSSAAAAQREEGTAPKGDDDERNATLTSGDGGDEEAEDEEDNTMFPFASVVETLGLLCRKMAPPVLDDEQ